MKKLPEDIYKTITQYLQTRPLGEILNLWNAIQQLEDLEVHPGEEAKAKPRATKKT